MANLLDFTRRSFQIAYTRCYLSPRRADNTYGTWRDVTRHVVASNMGQHRKSIDSNDFDIGFQEESNVTIAFDNSDGVFIEGHGYFEGMIIDRSKVRIVAGYRDINDPASEEKAATEVTFEGIIDDRGTAMDARNDNASFTVLSYSAILARLRTDPGAVANGQDFKTAFFNLLNRAEVNQLLTVDADNINPKVNQVINNAAWFASRQLKDSINGLLLASNSVLKIKDNTIYITARNESPLVRFQFFGRGSRRPANIENIQNYHNGLRRVITRVDVNGVVRDANDDLIRLYGSQLKTLDVGFITDGDTRQAIGDDILSEFQFPKPEFELTTDFLGNQVDILDLVTIDNEGDIQDEEPALYGTAVYGESTYVQRSGGVRIRPIEGFKVLGVTHDYRRFSTTLKLRSIGNRPFDSNAGYRNPIYGQAIYGLSRYAIV